MAGTPFPRGGREGWKEREVVRLAIDSFARATCYIHIIPKTVNAKFDVDVSEINLQTMRLPMPT